ncbi:MAG: DNA polymerase III subunit delta [Patescibacteria group bacterium]
MFFLLYGQDSYRSRKKLTSLRAKFKLDRDPTGLNESFLRFENDDPETVAEALFSSPFLADRKLIVLDGYLNAKKDAQEKIVDLLGSKPDSSVAIFYHDTEAPKASPLFDLLKVQKFTEDFKSPDSGQAIGFIAAECAALGLQIEQRAGQALFIAAGENSWTLRQEIMKLCAYAQSQGQATITAAMVSELVEANVEDSVFAFLDACTQGNTREAVGLLERMVDSGTNELQILAMLQQQLRSLVGVRDLLGRGLTDRFEIAKQLGIHPYPAGKAMSVARSLPMAGLRSLFGELISMEQSFKTGQGKLKAEIGLFAARMSKMKSC